jgi:hypothetical protein
MVLWSREEGRYGSAKQLRVFVLELSHGDEVFSIEMGLKGVVQTV